METVPKSNVSRSNLSSESVSVLAARELVPTPVVTRSGDVGRAEMTSTMVLRSQVREVRDGRSSAAIPEVENRPDVEFRQETEVDNPVEVENNRPHY